MKKENLNDFQLFYMELPKTEYLDDIEIQDEYDVAIETQGLSNQQVLAIARDSLDAANTEAPSSTNNLNLFSEKSPESE